MRTDDQLIHDLEAAFRAETADLRYTGRVPSPRTRVVPWTALPVAAAAAAVLVVPQVAGTPTATPPATPSVTPAPAVPSASPENVVTRRIKLAGATVSFQAPAGTPKQMHLAVGIDLPADATPVDQVAAPDQAWVGTDARLTDGPVLFLRLGGDEQTYAIWGEGWSRELLENLALS
jgi:hypothetical protein